MRNRICYAGYAVICLFIFPLWQSCDIINPDETLPTRIHIEPFQFQVSPGQGTAQQEISEVWVYANHNFLGAFAPPVEVHYLGEGPTRINLYPGIRNNGIRQDAIRYPLFTHDSIDFNASPGSTLEVHPRTRYQPKAFFTLLADFETTNEFIDNRDTLAASNVIRSNADVFEGSFAGQITMSEEAFYIEVGHSVPLSALPVDGRPAYLEFRYKSEVEMSIGLLGIPLNGQSYSQFFYLVRPSEDWNMLYIELTDLLEQSGLPAYKILFRSLYPANAEKPEYHIFLDNIKVVHLAE